MVEMFYNFSYCFLFFFDQKNKSNKNFLVYTVHFLEWHFCCESVVDFIIFHAARLCICYDNRISKPTDNAKIESEGAYRNPLTVLKLLLLCVLLPNETLKQG